MFAKCPVCEKDTFGKKRVQIIITKSTGKLEWLPFWFHNDCLKGLWNFERYIELSRIVEGLTDIFRKPK